MRRVVRTSLTIAMATVMIGFAVIQVRADRVSSGRGASAAPVMLLAGGMTLSSSRLQLPLPDYTSSAMDLGRAFNAISSDSFSVTGADLSAHKFAPYQVNLLPPGKGGGEKGEAPVPNPEPTTMLLLGTGLVCAAAVVRKRLKVRGGNSK